MVEFYWDFGKQIFEAQGKNERAEYGKGLLKFLSKKLAAEFGKGYTVIISTLIMISCQN
ncbi:DUF1016 N-terminal domain-containing protein [Lachnospiraceae bacterium 54-53]